MRSAASVRLHWEQRASAPKDVDAALGQVRDGHPGALLVRGDNLRALGALAGPCGGRAHLVYLDPPFLTGREHARVRRRRDSRTGRIVRTATRAFDDRWAGLDAYLAALEPRLRAARELLAADGCLVLHVDPKTSHYAKVLCDEIFGPRCFASEIVWRYRRWPSKTKNFQRVHDILLRYVKDPTAVPRFTQLYEPLAESTRRTWGDRKQRAVVDSSGRRTRSSSTAEASSGTPMGDVWDIGIVAPIARERTGYPTQKPEALLRRLVEACTRPGDLVVDPYAGSGTTLAVCSMLGRRSIGIDESPEAIRVTRRRLKDLGVVAREEEVLAPKGTVRSARRAPSRGA